MVRPLKETRCPTCGKAGSGLHKKWVLNEQKVRYYPYYWMAHSIQENGENKVKWCYVRKKLAEEILGSPDLIKKFNLSLIEEA